MPPTRDGMPRQCRTYHATSCSSKPAGVTANMSDKHHETGKQCRDEELGNIERPSDKKDVHKFKDKHNRKNAEKIGRSKWSKEEDEILIQMVNKHGEKNWSTIAGAIPGRSTIQCRMRWKFSLDPGINKDAWSQEEELKLIRAHQIYGNKWIQMVKHFPGRTSLAIKTHWRGPMNKKLDSYLASGLLEKFPGLLEILTVPQNDDSSDRHSEGTDCSSHKNQQQKKSKLGLTELGENADTLEGESSEQFPGVSETLPAVQNNGADTLKDTHCSSHRNQHSFKSKLGGEDVDASEQKSSDLKYARGLDGCAAKASERMMARSKQRARTRKRLEFLSSPVELKASTPLNPQTPLQKGKQLNPAVRNISQSNVLQDVSGEVASELANTELSSTGSYHPTDVHTSETSDPLFLELHQADVSELLDMPYCDGLMIYPPGSPHDGM